MDTLPPHACEGNTPFVIIPISKGYSVIVDPEDADLSRWHWYASKDPYAMRRQRHDGIRTLWVMHRIILERKLGRPIHPGLKADHRNGNTLDNRRENLREATPQQNQYNKKTSTKHAHGFKGLTFNKIVNKWEVHIKIGSKKQYLGYYVNPEDAARVYDRAALEIHGEFARLNFPEEDYTNA